MSNTTFTTAEHSAREAVEKFATPVYARFGLNLEDENYMVKVLTDPKKAEREYEDDGLEEPTIAAIEIRTYLWGYGGGTTSARVTCEVMTELGRGGELGYFVTEGNFKG